MSQKCVQISYELLFVWFFLICLDFGGPKWSPPPKPTPHTPSPASVSKFPFGRKTYENNTCFCMFFRVFVWFFLFLNVLRWLRRVAFVAWGAVNHYTFTNFVCTHNLHNLCDLQIIMFSILIYYILIYDLLVSPFVRTEWRGAICPQNS